MKLRRLLILPVLILGILSLLAACAPSQKMAAFAELPVGMAYAENKKVFFIHTEASDPEIATLLSKMMDSPVLYVPSLGKVPPESLANVYVFTNGIKGMGPLGFAPDVFDAPPGEDGYSPLRRLNLVTWVKPEAARELTSVADILAAELSGDITIEQPGIVINMPFIVWENGKR